MMREQRLEKIVGLVNRKGTMSLKEIQAIFKVSMVTIRIDQNLLIEISFRKFMGELNP